MGTYIIIFSILVVGMGGLMFVWPGADKHDDQDKW